MSWGSAEFSAETNYDSTFAVPGVTFLAATGDNGAPGSYPAFSPNVVAVGGTTLQNLDSNGDYPGTGTDGEIGWSGSGGGISQYEPEPSYQQSVQNTGLRTVPDISADADPNTGVAVYDPYNFGTVTPWGDVGGTSLSSPFGRHGCHRRPGPGSKRRRNTQLERAPDGPLRTRDQQAQRLSRRAFWQ